jgi:parallel beta helix pectate lyase-like protein
MGVLIAMFAPGSAHATNRTIISLTSCGVISIAGFYELDADPQAASGDCLVITVPGVTLNLNGATITGAQTGAGIHVKPKATGIYIEGSGATITGFTYGIEIDALSAFAENFTANANGAAGVFLKNSHQSKIVQFTTSSNGFDGVVVQGGGANVIQSFTAIQNGRYGVWLSSSSHDAVGNFELDDNATAGIYVGCSQFGPAGAVCRPLVPVSSYNYLFSGRTVGGSGGGQQFGIAIDLKDNNNKITSVYSNGNSVAGLLDENLECANNLWFAEVQIDSAFAGGLTAADQNPSCIR